MKMKNELLLFFIATLTVLNATDKYDDMTTNGSSTPGHEKSRVYRNPAISLHDNIFKARNLLSETVRVGAITTEVEYFNAMSMKIQNFYQDKIKSATHDFEFREINNRMLLDSMEIRLMKTNINKDNKK